MESSGSPNRSSLALSVAVGKLQQGGDKRRSAYVTQQKDGVITATASARCPWAVDLTVGVVVFFGIDVTAAASGSLYALCRIATIASGGVGSISSSRFHQRLGHLQGRIRVQKSRLSTKHNRLVCFM